MSCCDAKLYIDNSTVVQLGTSVDPLTNTVTNTVDTGATVTATIYDMTDTEVTGETWPVTLTHDANGIYLGVLSSNIAITENNSYKIVINATGTGGAMGKWTIVQKAEVRQCV